MTEKPITLRDLVHDKHEEVENSAFAKKLFSGDVTKEEYAEWLCQLILVYSTLETVAKSVGLLDTLPGLERAPLIYQDLMELGGVSGRTIQPATLEYVYYLLNLYPDRNKILAHMYVRHMGDLYGGQLLAMKAPGSGKQFVFEDRKTLIANIRAMLDNSLAEEANVAFDWTLKILSEYDASLG
jgi:heme oxygenase